MQYRVNQPLTRTEFIDLLHRSTLAERRPVDNEQAIQAMLDQADLLITAWRNDRPIGVARSVTDFAYCCYLSDLAVDAAHQGQGIGRELIRRTRRELSASCSIILLAAPAAVDFYPRIGFQRHESAWLLGPDDRLQ